MFGALDISTSALVAQRTRIDAIAGNLANADVTLGVGKAYQRRVPIFAVGASAAEPHKPGVHVAEVQVDTRPGELIYDPSDPHAFPDGPNKGMVRKPNVNGLTEMINGMHAVRAYEANIAVLNATKTMANAALRLLG
jgi:flagellar basal-body rod protein FlgC